MLFPINVVRRRLRDRRTVECADCERRMGKQEQSAHPGVSGQRAGTEGGR
jgi:hypothetical protein